jgi:hypothetical protein
LNLGLFFVMPPLLAQTSKFPDLGEGQPAAWPVYDHGEPNTLSLGLRISSEADSNALSDNRDKHANVMTVIQPHLKWNSSHPHLEWSLNYGNSFSLSRPFQVYSAQSHMLDAALRLRPSKRLKIVLANTFQQTKNPFDLLPISSASGSGLNRTSAAILPGADRILEQASGDLTLALSRRASIAAGGSFFAVRYRSAGAGQLVPSFLNEENSTSGHALYSYRLTKHQWSGFEYEVRTTSFGANTLVSSFLYTQKVSFSPAQSVSLYFGPQRNAHGTFSGILPTTAPWHWAGGATYTFASARARAQISFSRRIDASNELPGAALITSVTTDLRRPLSRHWTIDAAADYDRESGLDIARTTMLVAWIATGFSRALGPGLSLDLRYWRLHESEGSPIVRDFIADHNRASISFAYDFKLRPLR